MGKGEVCPESRVQEVAPPVNASVFSGVVGQYPRQNYACKKIQYEKLFFSKQDIHVLVMLVLVFLITDLSHSNVLLSQSTYNFK